MTEITTIIKQKRIESGLEGIREDLRPDYVIGYVSGTIWSWKNRVMKARKALKEIEEMLETYNKQREAVLKNWRINDVGKPE
jgi:hypothetical protein